MPVFRLFPLVALAIALGGCAYMPWFGSSEEAAETGAEEEPQPSEPDPGIATGSAARDTQYALLASDGHALVSADVGYFIDVHEARLRQALADSPVRMQRDGARLLLTIPGSFSFATGSARIMAAIRPVLREVATVLTEFDKTLVSVHGHTDDRGDAAYNRALSRRRAVAVAVFLSENGVAKERLVGIGHGEERPVTEEDTEQARTANRRIEIRIEPVVLNRKAGA